MCLHAQNMCVVTYNPPPPDIHIKNISDNLENSRKEVKFTNDNIFTTQALVTHQSQAILKDKMTTQVF